MGDLHENVSAYYDRGGGDLGSPIPTPTVTLTGEVVSDQFAYSVSAAGDVNGDGYADLIIGAPNYNGQNQGRIYIYYGSSTGLSSSPDYATGEDVLSDFGYSVKPAGDINGDGFDDVVVGAPRYPNDNFKGRVYIFEGSQSGLSPTPSISYTGDANGDWLGFSIGGAGDVNNDGYSDILIGVSPPTGNYTGEVQLYLGSSSGLSFTPAFTATGPYNKNFGYSVATVGDVNNDGYSDVAIGELGQLSTPFGIGHVYVYTGTPGGLNASPAFTLTGETPGDSFGVSVHTAGDVDGNGYDDIIVGAYSYPDNNSRGRAYVYTSSVDGINIDPALVVTGESTNSRLGVSVSTAGDVNGDGFDDVLIGAYGFDDGVHGGTGKTYIYFGSEVGLSDMAGFTAVGSPHGGFGFSVDTAGDVNNDGYSEVLIGALEWGSPGRAFVYLGRQSSFDLHLPVIER